MSLFELLSTMAGLRRTDQKKPAPNVSNDDWDDAMSVISELAQFDPSLDLG